MNKPKPDLEQVIVDTQVKERHRNNPEQSDKHTFSPYCSCGICHMAHLSADAVRGWMVERVGKLESHRYDKRNKDTVTSYNEGFDDGYEKAIRDVILLIGGQHENA